MGNDKNVYPRSKSNWVVAVVTAYARHAVGHLVAAPVIAVCVLALRGIRGVAESWAWVEARPWAAIGLLVAGLGVSYLIAVIVDHFRPKIGKYFAYRRLVRGCGLEDLFPRSKEKKTKAWRQFVDIATVQESDTIRILGLTGAATFAKELSPLRDLLLGHRGDIEILLVEPDSEAFTDRARELTSDGKVDTAAYEKCCKALRDDFEEALEFCDALADQVTAKLRSIEVRTYKEPVIWKMVFVGGYLWLQHYEPPDDVEFSPAYVLRRADDCSLYRILDKVFLRRWQMAEDNMILRRDQDGRLWPGH